MENKFGIKESKEVVDALKLIVVTGKKIMADGKVDLNDLPHVVEMAKNSAVIATGIEGAGQVPAEIKDLTMEEFAELGKHLYQAILDIKGA